LLHLLQLSDSFLLTRISNLQLSIHLLSPCYCRLGFLKVLLTSTLSLLPQHHARHLTSSRITTIQDPICLLLIHTFYQATITTSTLRIFQAASQQVFTHLLTRKTTISHFAIPHHITCTVKMVNFTAFITLIMGITTFFTDKLPVARVFTWSQKLIAAPPKCTPTHLDGYEELFTLVSPVTVFKTLTTATITMTAGLPTFTTIITPPGTDLALFTGTITTTSFFSLAKEFVCAIFTVPAPLTANAASLVTAFLFGTILLLATVGKVQDLRKEVKELKAGVVGAAPVPTQPILVCKSSTTVAEEMRARIETAIDPASGASSVPAPEPAAVALPAAAAAPKPLALGEQKRTILRRRVIGPSRNRHVARFQRDRKKGSGG
jgi:hypothetical protein